jgi:hypothetical protein
VACSPIARARTGSVVLTCAASSTAARCRR